MFLHLCCRQPLIISWRAGFQKPSYPGTERDQHFTCGFFFFSCAKQESCQAIVVWYGEGSWDLVTGTFWLVQTATSQQFPQGVKLAMMQGGGHLMTRSTDLLHNTVINKGICFCRKQSISPPDISPHSNVNHLSCFSLSHFCLCSLTY